MFIRGEWRLEEPVSYFVVALSLFSLLTFIPIAFLAMGTLVLKYPFAIKWRWRTSLWSLSLLVSYHLNNQLLTVPTDWGFWSTFVGWLACFALPVGLFLKWSKSIPELWIIRSWVFVSFLFILGLVILSLSRR